MARLSPLVNYDLDRGDYATILRSTYARFAEWDFEASAPVWYAFAKYMAGNPGDPIPELEHTEGLQPMIVKMMRGALVELIDDQKFNARHAYEVSKAKQRGGYAKRDKYANAPREGANAPREGANAPHNKTGQDITEGKQMSCPVPGNDLHTPTGTGGACAADAALSATIEGTVQYRDGDTVQTITAADFRCDYVAPMLKALGDSNPSATRKALINARNEIGEDRFDAMAWKFLKDFAAAWTHYDKTREEFRKFYSEKFPGAPLEGSDYEKKWETSKRGSEAEELVEGYWRAGKASKTFFGRLKAYRKK